MAEFIEYPEDSRTLFLPIETVVGLHLKFGDTWVKPSERDSARTSAWPHADDFRGTIDLHMLPPRHHHRCAHPRELDG